MNSRCRLILGFVKWPSINSPVQLYLALRTHVLEPAPCAYGACPEDRRSLGPLGDVFSQPTTPQCDLAGEGAGGHLLLCLDNTQAFH